MAIGYRQGDAFKAGPLKQNTPSTGIVGSGDISSRCCELRSSERRVSYGNNESSYKLGHIFCVLITILKDTFNNRYQPVCLSVFFNFFVKSQ